MPSFQILRSLSLRTQLLLMVVAAVVIGLSAMLSVLMYQAAQQQQSAALRYIQELATNSGEQTALELRDAVNTAYTLGSAFWALQASSNDKQRALGDAILRSTLERNTRINSVWSVWEPLGFDGRDQEFANAPKHDATGRYAPYFVRSGQGSREVEQSVVEGYADPNKNAFYQLPKDSQQNTLVEPYVQEVSGQKMLVTSVSVPLLRDGQFNGVVGVDFALNEVQRQVQAIHLYESGYASFFTQAGTYVGDRDDDRIGKKVVPEDFGMSLEQYQSMQESLAMGAPYHTEIHDPRLGVAAMYVQVPIVFQGLSEVWAFAVVIPVHEVLRDMRQLQWLAAGLGFLSLVMACGWIALRHASSKQRRCEFIRT